MFTVVPQLFNLRNRLAGLFRPHQPAPASCPKLTLEALESREVPYAVTEFATLTGGSGPVDITSDPTTYWQLGEGFDATTKAQANRWRAVVTELEAGETRLECLAALQAAYYIAAANVLGEAAFNQRFAQPISFGGQNVTPFVDYSTPWLSDRMSALQVAFLRSRVLYLTNMETKGLDPTRAAHLDSVRGQVREIVDKKLIAPLTGDEVYFSNSRFYPAIYPTGPWQGENTIVFVDKDGNRGFVGMGTSPKHDGTPQNIEQIKALLLRKLNGEPGMAEPAALTKFKAGLANRQDVKDAATAKGLTAAQYVNQVLSKAAEIDIGILRFGVAVL